MSRGRLITIEGLDGAGKTTLVAALAEELERRGVKPLVLREPGGVDVAERIRALLSDPGLEIGAPAETLLFAAARAQLVEEAVEPALAAGRWVVLDRFVDSSLAYQGTARGLGVERVRALNELATAGLVPDRTLFLRIDPGAGRARLEERGGEVERLELEPGSFVDSVAAAYDQLAAREAERIRTLDAAKAPEAVLEAALAELEDLLPAVSR